MPQYSTTSSPTFIQQGLVDSLEDPQTEREVQDMLDTFARRRRIIVDGLRGIPGLRSTEPKGAFYVLVDVSGTGLTGMGSAMKLLEERGVAAVPAIAFGDSCGNYIRMSYASSDENIQKRIEIMGDFVNSLGR